MNFATFRQPSILTIAGVFLLAAPAWAQSPIRQVNVVHIKADRGSDFEAAVKQFNEVYSKLPNARSRVVYRSLSGPNEYLVVTPFAKWSEVDEGPLGAAFKPNAELTVINNRIRNCVESTTTVFDQLLPELSLPRAPVPPAMLRIARERVRPDKTKEYEAVIKDVLKPAYTKAALPSLTVRRVRFGAPTNEYYISTRLSTWADLDGEPKLRKSMGEEAYQQMVAKFVSMTLTRELNVFRYRPDLSFNSNPAPTTTTAAAR